MYHRSIQNWRTAVFTAIMVTAMTFFLAAVLRFSAKALEYRVKYAVYVDGVAVCSSEDKAQLTDALSNILKSYMTDGTQSAYFKENVSVETAKGDAEGDLETLRDNLTVMTVSSETVSETLPFETEYTYSDELYTGETETVREGENGTAQAEYLVYSANGTVTEKKLVNSVVETEPVSELVTVGTKEPVSTGTYIYPTSGIISSGFGSRSSTVGSSNHKGIDIAAASGTEIYAADGGEVIYAQWASGYGNFIKIQHENGDITCYGHLKKILVEVGDIVYQGDEIGLMGSTGNSTGPHLHFEIRVDGVQVDPSDYLT